MPVVKWRFEDPADSNPATRTYQFEINPNQMNSPFPNRSVSVMGTTAVDGQILMWEGMREPAQLTFGGTILSAEQYEALRSWVYDRRGRIFLWDHYGRRMIVVLQAFVPEPVRTTGRFYWRTTYTINAIVLAVSMPTVSNEGA